MHNDFCWFGKRPAFELTVIRTFESNIDRVTGSADVALFTFADATGKTSSMACAVASSKTYYLIANYSSIARITNTAACDSTGAVTGTLTWTI